LWVLRARTIGRARRPGVSPGKLVVLAPRVGADRRKQVYVADVDGVALVVTVGYYAGEITNTGLAEMDAILATLHVGS
jgi:hypothetical protein